MAFGEVLVDEHSTSNKMPYLFNGKELDYETGLYYYGARYYDPKVSIFLNVDPLVEKTMTPYAYVNNNPIRYIDPDGKKPQDIIVTTKTGQPLFTLNDGKKTITKMNVEQLYKKGIQWFEPTADNYMPLKSIDKSFTKSDKVLHFTWNDIANFAEQNRAMIEYSPGGLGDWKAEGRPGRGYRLVDVGGVPYWGDAIGQIPFAVDNFTDVLESTGSVKIAREKTIEVGKIFGDGIGLKSDNTNGYDNAMIKRAINWAEKRYKVVKGSGWFGDNYDLKKTNHSPNNLSKPSNQ